MYSAIGIKRVQRPTALRVVAKERIDTQWENFAIHRRVRNEPAGIHQQSLSIMNEKQLSATTSRRAVETACRKFDNRIGRCHYRATEAAEPVFTASSLEMAFGQGD
jgi:hypothetical protein